MIEQVFTFRDGIILHRGIYLETETAVKLEKRLAGQAWADPILAQLKQAIDEAAHHEMEHA